MLNIAHITFDMRIGGAERVISNIVQHTDKRKYRASILCLDGPVGSLGKELTQKGYRVTSFDRQPGLDFRLLKQIRRHVIKQRIDILHCHQYTPYVYGFLGSLFTQTPVIFTEHGRFFPDRRRLKRILVNPAFSLFTDQITAISYATRSALTKFEAFPNDRINVVYNGIPESEESLPGHSNISRKSMRIPENAFLLGTIARLDPIKNHRLMIRAFKEVRRFYPDTYLIIVGDGPERKRLESLVSQWRLSPYVIFTGERTDACFFYDLMDVFLLTSFSEGTAMTLLEAMSKRVPCIATDVGGNPEIVNHEENGFIIPSDDIACLVEKILILKTNKATRQDMGQAARKRFLQNFTVDKMMRDYEIIYERAKATGMPD